MTRFLKLNDIDAYKLAFVLSNDVWEIVLRWDWLAKRTIGSQYTDSVDSISALIAEGFGRYFKKDKIHFYRMASGSTLESLDWTQKAKVRKLISEKEYERIMKVLKELPRLINQLIGFTNLKLKQ